MTGGRSQQQSLSKYAEAPWLRKHAEPLAFPAASFGLILLGWLWAYRRLRGIAEPLILHYSDYTGINQIGDAGDLGMIGGFGLIMAAVNAFLAFALRSRAPILSRIVSCLTLALAVLLFLAFMTIMTVNI